jgi:hypothetical protein
MSSAFFGREGATTLGKFDLFSRGAVLPTGNVSRK